MKLFGDVGEHISVFAQRLINEANRNINGISFGDFNGVDLEVQKNAEVNNVVKQYQDGMQKRHDEYMKTSEYKMREAERLAEIEKMSSEIPSLIAEINNIKTPDSLSVLNWLCKIQDHTDRREVKTPNQEIISKLESLGYIKNANTGEDFVENDQENYARWIIGQAMDGLASIGAIHHMCVVFTDRWKKKFNIM